MALATSQRGRDADAYMKLIRRFPLRPIRNDREHEQAVAVIESLFGRVLSSGPSGYLDTLILLVNKYEDENHTPHGVEMTPQQALRAIMIANNLSQADIGKIIGSESAVSMFLKGDRQLSKSQIKALVVRFHVDAGLFL